MDITTLVVIVGAVAGVLWLISRSRPSATIGATIWEKVGSGIVEKCPFCEYALSTEIETSGGGARTKGRSSHKINNREVCPGCGKRIERTLR